MKTKARLSAQILRSKCPIAINKARKMLQTIEQELKDSLTKLRTNKENKVLPEIKQDPATFYSYARTFSKDRTEIGPLMDSNENLVSDSKKMAEMLSHQYSSMFSTPSSDIKREELIDYFNITDTSYDTDSSTSRTRLEDITIREKTKL